jgi:HEAT repeat protein
LAAPAGVNALARVLRHPDVRVRREVLRALAAIRGPEAEGLLRRCLDDPEPALRGLAAEWLGIMNAEGILEEYRAMIRDRDRRLRSCHELAAGVVRAVGRLGGEADVPLLESFRKHSGTFGLLRPAEVEGACNAAIGEIRKRASGSSAPR